MNTQAFLDDCCAPFSLREHDCATAVAVAMHDCAPRLRAAFAGIRWSASTYGDAWSWAYVLARQCGARCVEIDGDGPAWGLGCFDGEFFVVLRSEDSNLWYRRGEHGPRRVSLRHVVIAWECV